MHRTSVSLLAVTCLTLGAATAPVHAQETTRKITDGGISVAGWMGTLAPSDVQAGHTVQDSKLAQDGDALHVTTGPAITYWNPANQASGDYTVSATFTEPQYMNRNDHPHPYGLVIAGSGMGTPQETYLYCAAYGNGTFIVRGFGPEPFQMNGRRGEANDAVHKAAGQGEPVTQDISMSVKGSTVSCSINGTVVASYDKADVVTQGKLASTDGAYGIRFGHNTEGLVTNLRMTKN